MCNVLSHYEVAEQLVGETEAWLVRVAQEFANGHGICHDHVDASEIASNMDREQRQRFETANL